MADQELQTIEPQVLWATLLAAPEMLEVLETIENDDNCIPAWLWERIQDVVKKAKGL